MPPFRNLLLPSIFMCFAATVTSYYSTLSSPLNFSLSSHACFSSSTPTIPLNLPRTPMSSSDCYACTQVGLPVFHSTSCVDSARPPQWQASAGSSLFPAPQPYRGPTSKSSPARRILDPRSGRVRKWNRVVLMARGAALAVDSLFFYTISAGVAGRPCLAVDYWLAVVATVLRTCLDGVHLCHLWLQFRLAYVSRESLVVGCGKLVWDPRAIAAHYVRSLKGFWFDIFVILPIPQVVFWSLVPMMVKEQRTELLMAILLAVFLFQFLPRVLNSLSLIRRMQKVTGYIFGTIWWGFGLNMIAYFLASHAVGGCWYVLAIQRFASCVTQHCSKCNLPHYCTVPSKLEPRVKMGACLDEDNVLRYGIYSSALPVISSRALVIKIIYPISWGLFQLSTFGNNLSPTSEWLEVLFCIVLVLGGLMLFTLLVGNIQVFLDTVMSNKREMQVRHRDMEWWMKRRQLSSSLRHRVLKFERQRWITSGTIDEVEIIKDLPDGLRRDIKRYLCLDLVKKVPFFDCLDDLILDNICDRVKPLIYSKDEKIMREGDPVQRMVFIVKGRIRSSQTLWKGNIATSILEAGSFLGDELLSWCLRRPFTRRLPASSATFICVESTEAFGLSAYDLHYITEHFRYKFANERVKRTLKYHSSHWRTWAAINIQLAWRQCLKRRASKGWTMMVNNDDRDHGNWLRYFATVFMSLRPRDHLE